ncbi:MAG: tRNA (N(6)-L-threonylcarbamoyladenosine(37)-C(2))-methylthiotransferase MtaB, partial [Methylobacteriaceae bacterium]|nr:tRNA (N(6)-L-threonylcarbamoyladenosine(37)-C(2))-methylthiotransferase MtaB [Methylobacteriaceae bacterium]
VVKERAKRLRDKGQEALERHLDGKVGQRLTVLSETGNTGRAADFTLVKLKKPVLSGVFLSTMIYGHNGRELLGERSTANDAR